MGLKSAEPDTKGVLFVLSVCMLRNYKLNNGWGGDFFPQNEVKCLFNFFPFRSRKEKKEKIGYGRKFKKCERK